MIEILLYSTAAAVAIGVPVYARLVRGRTYAIFGAVILGLSLPGVLIARARLDTWLPGGLVPWLDAGTIAGVAMAGLHMAHLVRARMRGRLFRLLVSVPGQVTVASGFMAGLWMLALAPIRGALGLAGQDELLVWMRWLDLLPFFVAVGSIATSAWPVTEIVRIRLDGDDHGSETTRRLPVERHRRRAPATAQRRPLRVVQITDPHLGPWQSIRALRATIERLLDHEPDLVLLTGDFLTMESNGTPGALAAALEPLRRRAGDCYAIFGNHDHEAPEHVRSALESVGVRLLVDEEAVAVTPIGPVHIIGADYVGKNRAQHIESLLARHPRRDGHLRLLLLHDPLGFHDVPPGEVDLTLSGHTHGGQVGLVSLGLDWTVLSRSRWPDHGLFARGTNRLYVHRGTGFYGFPLRIGVPGEASIMELFVS